MNFTNEYFATHKWLARHHLKLNVCQNCKSPHLRTEWANISGHYLRDVDDYLELCKRCHHLFDTNRDLYALRKDRYVDIEPLLPEWATAIDA